MVTPDGRVIEYKYDNWNHLSQVLVNSVPQANLVHDPYGRRVGLGYANGTSTSYSYNPSGYLTDLLTRDSQQATINSFAYTHDGVGNRKTMTELNGVHGYDYDKIYQLTKATHPLRPEEAFSYDPVGNRLNTSVDLDNALMEDGDYTYAYDYNGNLIEKVSKGTGEKTSYFYDFENRLVKVESPGLIAQYKYDPFGRRIEKNVNGAITRYTYDGPNILLEYDGENDIKSRYLHTLAIDDILSVEQGGKVYYYQKDGLGSVVALTDEAGQVVQSYEYDSFGKIVNQTGSIRNPFTYTGREYDEETGLYFYRARYYDPNAGRFFTKDPIGFAAGDVNLYRYVYNNPVNKVDPLGLQAKKTGIWSGAGGSIGGMLLSAGIFTGIYKVTSWDTGKSCWIMTACGGLGGGLGGSLSAESMWVWGAFTPEDLAGMTEGGVAFGGVGLAAVGGSYSPGGCEGNRVTGPIDRPSSSSGLVYGVGIGAGAAYLLGGCRTTVLSCN